MGAFSNVITRIKALITADNKQFKKTMGETKQVTKKSGMDFQKLGNIIKGSLAVAAVVKFGKYMLNVGKSMDLMNIKATAVFGAYKKEVEGMANDTAASMGLTKTEFINTAAGIQDLLIPIGFARKEATGMTKDMMGLAGALSTWTGGQISATEVGNIFAKAMLGEREQLKSLGISLSEAEIQSELLARGQKKLTGEALAQAKAQITLDLITAKSTDAQEAFAGAQDSLVVTMAKTGANIRGMGESLAIILNPAMNKGAKAAETLTGQLRQMLDEAAMVSSSDVLTTWEKWQYRLAGLQGGAAGMIKQMEILGMAMSQTDFDRMVDEILDAGGSMEQVEKQMAQFGQMAVDHAKEYYTEAKALRERDAAEQAAAEAERIAKQQEAWNKELAAMRKKYADMQQAAEEFDKALALTTSGAELAAMKTTKLAVATYQAGVEMDKIPEKGAMAALGVATMGQSHTSAAQQVIENISAMRQSTLAGQALTDTMYSIADAMIYSSSQSGSSFMDIARAAAGAAKRTISAFIAEGIAGQVKSAMATIPFPFGLIAASIAGGAAAALFNTLIPSFAGGGIVTKPTLAMVGDNPSGKEAMIPSELWDKMGGGSNVEVSGVLKGHDYYLMNKRYGEKLIRTGRA